MKSIIEHIYFKINLLNYRYLIGYRAIVHIILCNTNYNKKVFSRGGK